MAHVVYVRLFGSDHWHRYVSYFLVILYLSWVLMVLWKRILVIGNWWGLCLMCAGGGGCSRGGGMGGLWGTGMGRRVVSLWDVG